MSSSKSVIIVSGLSVEFIRKDIKNIHLSVLPPDGKVRLSAPLSMKEENARLAIVSRLPWIKKKQKDFATQTRETLREFVDGETHFFNGHKYLLKVCEKSGGSSVKVTGTGRIELRCHAVASRQARAKMFDRFYREHLRTVIDATIIGYCKTLKVDCPEVRIQRMKTKWGSCNSRSGRVLLNLELAKKPTACVEYILAHELVHLRVRHHNDEFRKLLEMVLPDWKDRRAVLNALPLAYGEWAY